MHLMISARLGTVSLPADTRCVRTRLQARSGRPLDFAMSLMVGTRLGPYEIVAPLGAGGMGEVYKARDTRLDRSVAIKVLAADIASDPAARERFEREARAVAALDHPHICGIHDVGEVHGTHFLVMPLLDGETLAARLEKGALPLDQALSIAAEIADALDKAHRKGLVHRDLKPASIMLTKSGAKLLDFGLVKLRANPGPISMSGIAHLASTSPGTDRGMIVGTVQYMAPEQVEGRQADSRSDIWALGAVIHEMVTGERPFTGDSPALLRRGFPNEPQLRREPRRSTFRHGEGRFSVGPPEDRAQLARRVETAVSGREPVKPPGPGAPTS